MTFEMIGDDGSKFPGVLATSDTGMGLFFVEEISERLNDIERDKWELISCNGETLYIATMNGCEVARLDGTVLEEDDPNYNEELSVWYASEYQSKGAPVLLDEQKACDFLAKIIRKNSV